MIGWTALHTGLPSFMVEGPVTVTRDGAILAVLDAGVHLFSDPMAGPGTHLYAAGGEQLSVERVGGRGGRAIVTDMTGRGVADMIYIETGDPEDFDSGVQRFDADTTRWPLKAPASEGSGTFTLLEPERRWEVQQLLRVHSPLIIGPAQPEPGMRMRRVIVNSMHDYRYALGRRVRFDVSWSEDRGVDGLLAPVITWGEYAAHSNGWTHESYEDLCRRIAGMP